MCQLCTGRQADYVPDPWTEARKAQVLAELWAAERAEQAEGLSINRLRAMLAASTATATTTTWRAER
jgi:hypothetical protein